VAADDSIRTCLPTFTGLSRSRARDTFTFDLSLSQNPATLLSAKLKPTLHIFCRQKMKDMRAKKLAKKLAKRDGEQWERHSDTRAASDGKRTSQGVQDDGFY
jgi:hypothetical protein